MNIYSCVDSSNIDKIIVLFKSCYYNSSNKEDLRFYLLIDKETTNYTVPSYLNLKVCHLNKNFLKENGWLDINNEFSKYFYKQGTKCNHLMNFCRFFIFEHFPELDTVIYLDWDMIVQDDIFKLYEDYKDCEINNNLIVANSNKWKNIACNILDSNTILHKYLMLGNNVKNRQELVFRKRELNRLKPVMDREWDEKVNESEKYINDSLNTNIDFRGKSFNAGFMIVNRKIFDMDYLKQLINILIEYQKEKNYFRFGTQVIMNLLTNNKKFIDSKWNDSDLSSSIIHWSGPEKPWENENEIWMKYKNLYEV